MRHIPKIPLHGTIAFADFMAAALFDPDSGYYTRNIRTVGRRGDFSTSATLSDSLARAIARWIKISIHETGVRHIIETGGGDGSLARDVFSHLGILGRLALKSYTIVDISDPLTELQKEKLKKIRSIRWEKSVRDALAATAGNALFFSNEAVDAFPADVFRWRQTSSLWERLHVRFEAGKITEHFEPVAQDKLPQSSVFELEWPDGQRIELHESYRQWLNEWAPNWNSGRILTIDYGDTCPALYYRRPNGSLRAYFHQTMLEGTAQIAANPGKQDITADVNFTDLQDWGTAAGLKTHFYETQAEFLQRHGISGDIYTGGHGPGVAFKVLCQER